MSREEELAAARALSSVSSRGSADQQCGWPDLDQPNGWRFRSTDRGPNGPQDQTPRVGGGGGYARRTGATVTATDAKKRKTMAARGSGLAIKSGATASASARAAAAAAGGNGSGSGCGSGKGKGAAMDRQVKREGQSKPTPAGKSGQGGKTAGGANAKAQAKGKGKGKGPTTGKRAPPPEHDDSSDNSSSDEDDDGNMSVGDEVEALWKGRSHYYPARVTRVQPNGTYDVDYHDGVTERGLRSDLVRLIRRATKPTRGSPRAMTQVQSQTHSFAAPAARSSGLSSGLSDGDFSGGKRRKLVKNEPGETEGLEFWANEFSGGEPAIGRVVRKTFAGKEYR